MSKHLIWVCVTGGVIGFEPYEIAAFEIEAEKQKVVVGCEDFDKWAFFNEYFEDELCFREAYAYSALWRDEEAWEEVETLVFDMQHEKKAV